MAGVLGTLLRRTRQNWASDMQHLVRDGTYHGGVPPGIHFFTTLPFGIASAFIIQDTFYILTDARQNCAYYHLTPKEKPATAYLCSVMGLVSLLPFL